MTLVPEDRERLAWWAFTLAMVGALGFVVWSFVGTVVFGVFLYYGMRPLDRQLRRRLSSDVAADLTVVLVALPVLGLVGFAVAVGFQELSQLIGTDGALARLVPWSPDQPTALFEDLRAALGSGSAGSAGGQLLSTVLGTLAAAATGLSHFFLSLLLSFVLLREDARIAAWFRNMFGGEGSAAHAYAAAVDQDLHEVYVGNVLTVFAVTALGLGVYNGLDLLAPSGVGVPVPTLLALLTGLATLVPLVVGKIVYVPVGLLLAYRATTGPGPDALWFPIAFFAAAFVLLDLLPVAVLRPYIAGRHVHGGLMVFAYIGGTMLFGWYGLFLGPMLVVLGVHLARIVLPELIHGETVTREVRAAESLGSNPGVAEPGAAESGDADESGPGPGPTTSEGSSDG
ncbi:AI-2E family transporter [Halorussus marinus]|uniref:AI-2E family transporter n=1 Tax=Halorussus marinus TaxID=2505976 RepID=UPI00106DFBC3|nr:AI-2E family transporter [Halorussus marinus]